MTKEAFIKELTNDLPTPPQYFFHDVTSNKSKIDNIDDIVKKSLRFSPLPSSNE